MRPTRLGPVRGSLALCAGPAMARPVPLHSVRRRGAAAAGPLAAALRPAPRRGAARISALRQSPPSPPQPPPSPQPADAAQPQAPAPREGRRGPPQQPPPAQPQPQPQPPWRAGPAAAARWLASWLEQRMEAALYTYYNTRSTSTDLRLFAAAYASLMLTLACVQHYVLDSPGVSFGADLYAVSRWVFGESFPSSAAAPPQQFLAVLTGLSGLLGFALILALVEQVVLDGLDANVRKGRRVFEKGHILILSWCASQRDLEVVRKVLSQLCLAYRAEGGTTIVVMSQRSKLEMESMALRDVPPPARFGTRVVFRQGSPLVPGDLALVAAHEARVTLIVSDQSRSAVEADAQSIRAAILLDELDTAYLTAHGTGRAQPRASGSGIDAYGGGTASGGGGAAGLGAAATISSVVASVAAEPGGGAGGGARASGGRGALESLDEPKEPAAADSGGGSSGSSSSGSAPGGASPDGGGSVDDGGADGGGGGVLAAALAAALEAVAGLAQRARGPPAPTAAAGAPQEPAASSMARNGASCADGIGAACWPESQQQGRSAREAQRKDQQPQQQQAGQPGRRQPLAAAAALPAHGAAPKRVVVELKTANALPLLKYSCTDRIAALPTGAINAQRMAQLIKRPFASLVGQQLTNFESAMNAFVHKFPELTGVRFRDLQYRFPDGVVLGVIARRDLKSVALLPPNGDYLVGLGDSLVVCRPCAARASDYRPLPEAPPLAQLFGASAAAAPPLGVDEDHNPRPDVGGVVCTNAGGACDGRGCNAGGGGGGGGGGGCRNMEERVRRARARASAAASQMGECGGFSWEGEGQPREQPQEQAESQEQQPGAEQTQPQEQQLTQQQPQMQKEEEEGTSGEAEGQALTQQLQQWQNHAATAAIDEADGSAAADSAEGEGDGGGDGGDGDGGCCSVEGLLVEGDTALLVPSEYLQAGSRGAVDPSPETVLVAGWGSDYVMEALMRELDVGYCALPAGSHVVFVNTQGREATVGHINGLKNIKAHHIRADPLQRGKLRLALGKLLPQFHCALVLCDHSWLDPDRDDANGLGSVDAPSVLRIDSLIMTVQLNLRKIIVDQSLLPINIVAQKVGTGALTRFEDRQRLPLGIAVNFNSFTAKLMAQLAVNPSMLKALTQLGAEAQLHIVDAACLANPREAVSWWTLAARCSARRDVLLGFYEIPGTIEQPLRTVVNPVGMAERCAPRVWNNGQGRLKFIVLRCVDVRKVEHQLSGIEARAGGGVGGGCGGAGGPEGGRRRPRRGGGGGGGGGGGAGAGGHADPHAELAATQPAAWVSHSGSGSSVPGASTSSGGGGSFGRDGGGGGGGGGGDGSGWGPGGSGGGEDAAA
ncbi:hypothetical protein Rsub_04643 [Raphidocelis subcapitata]|uniref:RCK N-terminal domain-containing protein n=1 Tax=Raphidocelis subcapitata TaxID=307507 RepID=A0A2V0NX54_9CHLO|nr:hypothetical protein Rsub_04643 [Raphidocelis subcapitata]|eukprot:GBF91919.1 hypothetical protein Rsub_04643 [Raphidocelis subcapitata]